MSMPCHPDQDNEPASSAPSRRAQLIITMVVVLVVGVIALHLAGVFGH
jgi:hypothetical protein